MLNKGYCYVAAGAVCWGTIGAISKVLFAAGLSSLVVANFRVLLSCIIIGLYLLLFQRHSLAVKKKDLPLFAVTGFISVCLFNISYLTSIHLTTIVTSVILLYTAPIFVTIISFFVFHERLTKQKLISLLLTFIGCILVVKAYDLNNLKLNCLGLIIGLTAGLTYGLYSILGKKLLFKYSAWTTIFYCFAFGTLFLSFWGHPWHYFYVFNNLKISFFLFLLSFIATVLAYIFYTAGLALVESSQASIVATIEPVVAVLIAFFLFHEKLYWPQIIGIFLVIISVFIIQSTHLKLSFIYHSSWIKYLLSKKKG